MDTAIIPVRKRLPRSSNMGRRKLPEGQVRELIVKMRVTRAMNTWLEEEAQHVGMSKTDLMDMYIRFHATKTRNPRPIPAR